MARSYRFIILFVGATILALKAVEQPPQGLTQALNASCIQIKHCLSTNPVVSQNHAIATTASRAELQALYRQANDDAAKLNKIDSLNLNSFLTTNKCWTVLTKSEAVTQYLQKWDKADNSTHFSGDFDAFISAINNKTFRIDFTS